MGRAFGELDQAFYDSGAVLSQNTCTHDARRPQFRPRVERSSPHLAISGQFTEAISIGVPECIELGGYFVFDEADRPEDVIVHIEIDEG